MPPTSTQTPVRRARQFNLTFLSLVVVGLALFTAIAATYRVEPVVGDLTRVGLRYERDWRPAHLDEAPPRRPNIQDATWDAENGYADVLVFGDSFSFFGFWQSNVEQ